MPQQKIEIDRIKNKDR